MGSLIKLIGRVYEALWRATTRRPWTYVMREWAARHIGLRHALVTAAMVAWLTVAGLVLAPWWGAVAVSLLAMALGALWGHLFWDTRGDHIQHPGDFDASRR